MNHGTGLIRLAANPGVLWIVKFLVEKGTPTKNLPKYGMWDWDLESSQLYDILTRKQCDTGLGKEYMKKKKESRQNKLI